MRRVRVPQHVLEIVEKLKSLGHSAYVTGGAVRDMFIEGREPSDWDVATSATPREVTDAFDRVYPSGITHGTVTVVTEDGHVEVTTYRQDGPYRDGRHPESVEFVNDIRGDLSRRDFTVNAMAYDPSTGELVDPYGGMNDLEARIIRTVGRPHSRFSEDHLRLLRAVRFAAQLGFSVDASTMAAIREHACDIADVSAERITGEFLKLLTAPAPSRGLRLLVESGLVRYVLPELVELSGSDSGSEGGVHGGSSEPGRSAWHRYEWASAVCDLVPADEGLRLAALFCASPGQDPADSASRAREALTRMRLPRAVVDRAVSLVRLSGSLPANPDDVTFRRFAAYVGKHNILDLLQLERAKRLASGDQDSALEVDSLLKRATGLLQSDAPLAVSDLEVNGSDVIELTGIAPGPAVRAVLLNLLDQVIELPSRNQRDTLRALIPRVWEELGMPGRRESHRVE
ncbi:MAG: [cytidine(C)-cytidine(C)-adenosine (A)]-adding enzyme [Firmicutes bacterium]|jgi:tRNA nucleotidyltransferase (CCA-adding enzyme)|nr:[cytidine(C)-cytidine(C)-adenosine (A)]-adding enzyme [Bacillota bacterium]